MSDPARGRPGSDPGGKARNSERRLLLWSGGVLAALVVLAAVFSFVGDAELDPDTPEGVVQDYLRAVIAGDRPGARSYLADELDGCSTLFPRYLADRAFRIEWLDTILDAREAWVTVSVAEAEQGIFGDHRPETYEFRLISVADGWRITHQEWPWFECSADSGVLEPEV